MTQLFLMISGPDGFPLSMTKDSLETNYEVTVRSHFNFKDPNGKGSGLVEDGRFFAWLHHNNMWFLLLANRTEDYYQAAAVADLRKVIREFTNKYNEAATKKEQFKKYEFGDYDQYLEKELVALKSKTAAEMHNADRRRSSTANLVHGTPIKRV